MQKPSTLPSMGSEFALGGANGSVSNFRQYQTVDDPT